MRSSPWRPTTSPCPWKQAANWPGESSGPPIPAHPFAATSSNDRNEGNGGGFGNGALRTGRQLIPTAGSLLAPARLRRSALEAAQGSQRLPCEAGVGCPGGQVGEHRLRSRRGDVLQD